MNNIKDLLKAAKLPERSVTICLDAAVTADIEKLERKLEELDAQPNTATLEGDPKIQIALEIKQLEADAQERTQEFRFRALPRQQYTQLVKQHPPRADDAQDLMFGYNRDTFFNAMIRASMISPEMDDEDLGVLLGDDNNPGVLSFRQFDKLASAAYNANERDVDVPFSQAASETLRTSEPE